MAPPMTGRAIKEAGRGIGRKVYDQMMSGIFGIEVLYSFVIIICSLMIYYGTKEIYELSNHKGIKYFRNAFLFFALAYFVRTFIKFLLIYFDLSKALLIPIKSIAFLTLPLFVYFSTMGLFYLLYSLMYKKWKSPLTFSILQGVSITVALISTFTKDLKVILLINIFVLLFVLIAGYVAHKETKKNKNSLYAVYALLFAFFVLNILDILIPSALQTFQLLIYLASTGIFLTILYKVLRRVGV